ncbi:hypothetical protein [Roseovarius amoyensis]|uniref:hypothetical protein n=1 Tax=Roseovarius amoyensis TaxID=2211448 RepID=UPI0013A70982|nr:hypothetical protein [Roseovarius amoyensis]
MGIPALRLVKTFGFGETDSGKWLVIEGEDQNGQRLTLRIPFTIEGEFLSKFQAASATAAKARGSVMEAAIANAMNPRQIDFGVTDEGKIGLRMQMQTGTTLDLLMGNHEIDQFRSALNELDTYQQKGGPERSQ